MNQTKQYFSDECEAKSWRTLVTTSYKHSMYDVAAMCHEVLSQKEGPTNANVISYERGDNIVVLMYCVTSDFNEVIDRLMNFEIE